MRLPLPTLVLVAAPWAVAQDQAPIPTFPSTVELITVDAVVLDKEGHPVAGLTKEDFLLREDGRPQTLASFEALVRGPGAGGPGARGERGPVSTNLPSPARAGTSSFILLVDDTSLTPFRQDTVRNLLTGFVSDAARDGDELIFATTSGDAWWSARLPEGREDLLALAGRVRGRNLNVSANEAISEWEAYRIVHFESPGGDGTTAGMPEGPRFDTQPGMPRPAVAGAEMTERVVSRYYERRICNPDRIPPSTAPMTPVRVCRSMVRERAQAVDLRRTNRTRDVLRAVDRAVFALTAQRGRKSLLLLTEGFLNDADLDVAREVAGRCREANIAVYSVDVRGLLTGLSTADRPFAPAMGEMAAMQMEETDAQAAGSVGLAEDTGGFAVRDTNDLLSGAARAADESRVYYLLGYAPPPGKGPRDWRRLEVEVKQPGLTVRARKGYTLRTTAERVAAEEARLAAARKAKAGPRGDGPSREPLLPADVARAVLSGAEEDGIPLRAMAYHFEEQPSGSVKSLIAVEVDTRRLANLGGDEGRKAALALSISITDRDSGRTQRTDQRVEVEGRRPGADAADGWEGWLTLSREFDLPPGVAQARIVVRDEFLGRLGALTLRFTVPSGKDLRLSTPVLTDRLLPARPGEPERPALVAHREFTNDGRLYCQFQVYGAAAPGGGPNVEASFELRRPGGQVVRRSGPGHMTPGAGGRLAGFISLTLDGVAPGDYDLVLRVHDQAAGKTRERTEALRIAERTPGRQGKL